MHHLSMERIHNFRTAKRIDVQLNDAAEAMHSRKEKEREENRSIVQVIFDVVRHLAKQNSAFRGHDESADSTNQGNFLEELEFLAKYHEPLRRWMVEHPQNLSYFSPGTQNGMISILANLIVGIIKSQVVCAKYFSIECDEVTSHKKAFMTVVIRYVHDFKIWERCIKLERISSLKGKDLADIIVAILKDWLAKVSTVQATCLVKTRESNNT